MRDFGVRVKLNPVTPLIENKRIIIVEDSIIRGTTSKNRVDLADAMVPSRDAERPATPRAPCACCPENRVMQTSF